LDRCRHSESACLVVVVMNEEGERRVAAVLSELPRGTN
jgi:hypothetical protein